jgi:hypothetical protein
VRVTQGGEDCAVVIMTVVAWPTSGPPLAQLAIARLSAQLAVRSGPQ